jgi:NADH-ubiquinone oxidoreductase chain 4L
VAYFWIFIAFDLIYLKRRFMYCLGLYVHNLMNPLFNTNVFNARNSSRRKHLLITLLRLEFIVLVLYFSIYFYLCNFNYSLFFVVYFLVFSVCEGSLGLSVLVFIISSHGNGYFQSFRVIKC